MKPRHLLSVVALVAACAKPSSPPATPPGDDHDATPAPGESPFDAQAQRGGELYGTHCAECHGAAGEGGSAPAVVGEGVLTRFADAAEVYAFASEKMPGDAPGTVPQDDMLAILAFDLKANGVHLDEELSTANAADIKLGGK